MPVAIGLPMRVDDYGQVVTSTTLERIWADRVRSVLNTTVGERTMRPEFGSRIPMGLLDSIPEIPQLVEDAVGAAFARHLPTLRLISVNLIYTDEENGEIGLDVAYAVPGSVNPASVLVPYQNGYIND